VGYSTNLELKKHPQTGWFYELNFRSKYYVSRKCDYIFYREIYPLHVILVRNHLREKNNKFRSFTFSRFQFNFTFQSIGYKIIDNR